MKNIPLILIASCMVFFSCCCCCCCDEDTVTYKVSGSVATAGVMFNNDYGITEDYSSVELPWIYRFTIKKRGSDFYGGDYNGYFPAHVSARKFGKKSGDLNVTIYVGGKPVASASVADTATTAEARFNVEF